ncbi:MAG TPA: hypothetical protein VLD57_00405, partial [Blastocatellia bacterium]|nr:hypothetical protein [Blastocatellia bacterium]
IGADRQLDHFLAVRSRMSDVKRILRDGAARFGKARGRALAVERKSKEASSGEAHIEDAASDRDGSRGFQRVIRWDITSKYNRIMDGYVPRRYGGRISLFWPDEAEPEGDGDPLMGWGKVAAGGVDLYRIAGKHLTCITRHVDVLAEQMNACLRRAQGIDGK